MPSLEAVTSPRRLRCLLATLALGTLGTGWAHAAQTVVINESDTTVVRISSRDQTRIRAEQGRLLDLIGDVFDPQKNPAGRLVVLKDEADGEFYVKLQGIDTSPIKLDVKSDHGTVGLLLQPASIVSDTLVLRIEQPATRRRAVAGTTAAPAAALPAGRSASHVRAIKALLLSMALPAAEGASSSPHPAVAGEVFALWPQTRLTRVARRVQAGLTGETYELSNLGPQPLQIDEQDLYRSQVLAVAVRQRLLQTGESTTVWIVRSGTDHAD